MNEAAARDQTQCWLTENPRSQSYFYGRRGEISVLMQTIDHNQGHADQDLVTVPPVTFVPSHSLFCWTDLDRSPREDHDARATKPCNGIKPITTHAST